MKKIKISMIGAGSGAFSLGFIKDICMNRNLEGSTVSFMDINPERLDAVHAISTRYAKEQGIDLKLEKTTNRRDSLKDADFVVSSALAAGHDRLKKGFHLALKHGFRFPGSYHILYGESFWTNFYQLRLMESITEDILDVCPNAWHIMVMNPVAAGTTHILRNYPAAKMVGLCHGYIELNTIAGDLGLSPAEVNYEVAGINHFIWLTKIFGKGEDKSEELFNLSAYSKNPRKKLMQMLGAHPIGDTADWTGALWPWWNNMADSGLEFWKDDPDEFSHGWDAYFNFVDRTAKDMIRHSNDEEMMVSELFSSEMNEESIVPLLESLALDKPGVFVVNLLNSREFVPGIPKDFAVEIPAYCSKLGVQGIETKELPKPIRLHLLRDRVVPIEMELEAYTTGNKALLIQLIMMDRFCTSKEQAEAFLDELLSLPFHEEMRNHYN